MKLTLNIDLEKLTKKQEKLLEEITEQKLFPIKNDDVSIELHRYENFNDIPAFLKKWTIKSPADSLNLCLTKKS